MTSPSQRDPRELAGPYSIGSDHWPGISKLFEEMGELGQVIGKIMAINGAFLHWDGTNLLDRLHEEMADVMAALYFVANVNRMDRERLLERTKRKLALFHLWHREQGGVDSDEDPTP
jgi:NTP pyrophosphatase (non-canonical NTP hydrolase)